MAQVSTVQITAYDAATTYILTMNGKTVSVIAQGSVNATATGLAAAWNALSQTTYPEFAEVTASAATDTVTLTADTAGKPFTATSSVSGGTGTIGAVATPTASAGPNHWDTAANWSASGVPSSGDTVYIENSNVDILYGLDQSSVASLTIHILASYTGKIGLAEHNGTYFEYRTTYLTVGTGAGTVTLNIGAGIGQGSGRLKINTGAANTTVNVYHTAASTTTGIEALLWKGTHASNVVNLVKGSFGAAVIGGETATIATLRAGYASNVVGDVTARIGSGVTLTTLNQSGGSVELNSNITTINTTDGKLTLRGSMTVTTLNLDGGTCYYQSTGTCTTVNVGSGGKLSFTQDMQARTVSNCNVYAQGALLDPFRTVTFTNGIDLERCSLADVTLDVGTHVRLTVAAAA